MKERRPLVAGNWKMNAGSVGEALGLVNALLSELAPGPSEVVVCPPFTAIAAVADRLLDEARVRVGAQDVFWEPRGPFTGAIAPGMLVDCGCHYAIVGHSERRTHFRETEDEAARKALAALSAGLGAIFCVGETLAERGGEEGPGRLPRGAEAALARQLAPLLSALTDGGWAGRAFAAEPRPPVEGTLVVAYEPVWAIGTGRAAEPADAAAAARAIRRAFAERLGEGAARSLRILYGGSVHAANAAGFFADPDLDGALVGGASLAAHTFAAIVRAADEAAA
ncbi:MAG: triose-phosphate isomerase [Clostridia bacterium]|nr:triose-phosphate isomerase [Clostridia bacterium]